MWIQFWVYKETCFEKETASSLSLLWGGYGGSVTVNYRVLYHPLQGDDVTLTSLLQIVFVYLSEQTG
jgi:hypothetical protein